MFVSMMKSKIIKIVMIALFVFIFISHNSFGADHTVSNTVGEYFWTYGCTPTATSMVLGYWDDHYYYGRLIDYYYDNDCGNSGHVFRNVPNTIDELRDCMGTSWSLTTCSGSGTTSWEDINPGIDCVTDSRNGYSFTYYQCTDCDDWWDPSCWGGDWCWDEMKAEIDGGRPFVWSTSGASASHSVAAWGYRDDKYIILYDTWWPGGREDWYYSWYCGNSSDAIDYVQQERVWPGGEVLSTLELDDPIGGESLLSNHPHTIWWYQWGTIIDNVDLYYSTDRGENWTAIAGYIDSVSGWNSYQWWVPNLNSLATARVRVSGYDGDSPYIAGDGSLGNFSITKPSCASLSYPTSKWQRVWYIQSSGICLGAGPDEYDVQFDNDWGTGTVAHSRSDNIRFSSSRRIYFSKSGNYRFTVGSDDGLRLWIDNVLKINQWIDRAYTTDTVDVYLNAGYHDFRLDYYEQGSLARVSFAYSLLPDLIVQSLLTSPATPYAGQNVTVTATVKNQGIAPAGNAFYLELYKHRDTAPEPYQAGDAWCYIDSLGIGATTTCVKTFTYSAAGTYKLWSQVDSWLGVNEINENNNVYGPKSLLVVTAPSLSVTPADGFSSLGYQGGPFSPSSKIYTLTNTGGSAVDWSVSRTKTWISLSSTSGILAAGASFSLTASINSSANSLAEGSYSDTISFTNTTNGSGNTTRPVSLIVMGERCEGDLDNDRDVDDFDLALFAANFGRTDCHTHPPCNGDIDDDGDMGGSDLAAFSMDFGRTDCP